METLNIASLPLDLDLNSVDTSMPLLEKGIYDVSVAKVEMKKTSKGGDMLHFDFVTTAPSKSMKGEDLGPNIHVFDNCNLTPTGKATPEMVVRNIASIAQAAGFVGTLQEFLNGGYMTLQGRTLRVRVGYEPAGVQAATGKSFREKNTIEMYIKPGTN